MLTKFISKFAISSLLLAILSSALAENQSANLVVSAVVVPSCTIQGNAISFGNYNTHQLEQTSNVGVNCSQGTSYVMALDTGSGANANVATRQMTGPANGTLNYSLFQDAAYSRVWGNTAGSNTVAGTGNGNLQSLPVYGRVPAGQVTAPGVYNDVVGITLTY
ncbi:Csu type fimbrial protein [Undibacterium sp. TJN19]|uniref:Csu type fimbrial protein n=1 Tax=Undibacterium sp. TJN19 TaxID=3413055 RepID=UPI003BF3CC00